jgi:hypothetical protein
VPGVDSYTFAVRFGENCVKARLDFGSVAVDHDMPCRAALLADADGLQAIPASAVIVTGATTMKGS